MPTLNEFPPNSRVRVLSLSPDGALSQRLMELGLLPGTPVRVVRLAPFGDPIDLEIRGYHLSLRKSEARAIEVEVI